MKKVYGPFLFVLVCLVSGIVQAATLSGPTASTVTFTVSKSDATCNGYANGSIVVTASGGTSPYQYSKDNGATFIASSQFVNQLAGTYQIVVKDAANGKTPAQTVVISQPTAISYTTTIKNVSCFGGNDGSVLVDASGGQGPYKYYLYDMAPASVPTRPVTTTNVKQAAGARAITSREFTGLQAQTYYLNIVDNDGNGCYQTGSITIQQPSVLSFSTTASNVRCAGGTSGSITVSATGGTGPYQYSNDNGATFQNSNQLMGLSAGSYQVVVKDANGCLTDPQTVTLTEPKAMAITVTKQNAGPCYGNASGSITVSATGGTAPYQYSKDNGATFQTSNQFTNLAAGNYSIVVKDANGCVSTAQPVVITQPAVLSFSTAKTNVSGCYGESTGSITVTASGGTGAYQYSKDNGTTFQNSNQFTGLSAGTYQVTVKDANGCTATVQSSIISQPAQLNLSTAKTDVSCNGSTNGTLTITATGGTVPYQYSKDNGTTFQSGNQFTNLAAGRYPILVKDANGCLAEAPSVTINQPTAVSITNTKTDATCSGGSTGTITLTASGGTGPYQYSKDNGATFQSANQFTNLPAGSYLVVVKDANNCVTSAQTVAIGQPSAITINTLQTDATCNGYSNGAVSVTASGGNGPYQYSKDNGATYQTDTQFIGLNAVTYSVVAKDSKGCTSVVKSVVVNQPIAISYIATSTNVSCYGGTDGSVTITASGGTGPYQYQITDAAPASIPVRGSQGSSGARARANDGAQYTGLSPKLYHIIIRDANGCTKVADITISQPLALSITTTSTNAQCLNSNTGSINVNAVGGTGAYQYSKDNGATFQSGNQFTNLAAGTYQVIVKDANNCLSPAQSATIGQPTAVTFSTAKTDVACFGGNNGTITLTASGGTGSYQYSKDNGATFQTGNQFTGLTAATYQIIVKDANGCLATTQPVTINQAGAINVTISKIDITTCYGASTGSINVGATGGTAPYQYSRNNGTSFQTSAQFSNLPADTYPMVVKDANGCVSTAQSITINQPTALAFAFNQTNVACAGGNTGSLTVSTTGGTGSYQYSKDNGTNFQVNNVFSGLSAGSYGLVVKDANGCTTAPQPATITQPANLSFTTVKTDVSCAGGNTGQITVSATGGTTAYQYSKDNGATFQSINQFTSLPAGTYPIIVKDANGCTTAAQSITVNQPAALASTSSQTNVTGCYGTTTGSIRVSATGGTGAYQYSITNGASFQGGNAFNNLTAGTYQVLAKDANGCTTTAQSVVLTQPAALMETVTKTDVATCYSGNTGSITVTASGGTSPYQYSKDNGATFQTSNQFAGLVAGTYAIVTKDAAGCVSAAQTVLINQPAQLTEAVSVRSPTCYGQINGTVSVTASGGTAPYQYSKDNGLTYQNSNQFTVGAGDYTVIVKDANGCLSSSTTATVRQPTLLQLAVTGQTNLTCFGGTTGSISVSATGGTGTIGFSVNGGSRVGDGGLYTVRSLTAGVYTMAAIDDNGCSSATQSVTLTQPTAVAFIPAKTNVTTCYGATTGSLTINATGGTGAYLYSIDNGVTFQASNTFTTLPAGSYSVVVKDANGCLSPVQTITISQPAQLFFTTTKADIGCAGSTTGTISVSTMGGTAPYQYSKDNGVTFQTSSTFLGLAAGNYTIMIRDANGCTAPAQSLTVNQAATLTFTASQTNLTCYGISTGNLAVTASGGTAPYQYSSDNGRTYQVSAQLTGLSAGVYGVQVKDANGCIATAQSFTLTQPTALTVAVAQTNNSCFGASTGSISLTATGGMAPYQYSRDNGATFQNAGQFIGLSAGSYTIVVRDANGCTSSVQSVTLTQPAQVTFTTTSTSASCFGSNTGSITVSASGGTGSYQYSRDNGNTFQANNQFTELAANTYLVVVKDANGCVTATQAIVINQPATLNAATSTTNVACYGTTTGSLAINATGGTVPYQYSKDNGATFQTSSLFATLAAGSYTIVVRDANGCTTAAQSVTLTQPATAPSLTATKTDATCTTAGSVTISASGGTAPYQYSNDNGNMYQTGNIFTGLSAGVYRIVVKDANSCVTSAQTLAISQPTTLSFTTTQLNITCFGGNSGSLAINATGGTTPYQYSNDNGTTFQASNRFTSLVTGTYGVVVKDGSGCLTPAQSVTLTQPTQVAFVTSQTNVACAGASTGVISITASGGTAPYQYSKDNGTTFQSTNSFSNLPAGSYTLLIRDVNGCMTAPQSVSLIQPTALSASTTQINPTCFGASNGSITVSGSGGTAPYQYSRDNGQSFQSANTFANSTATTYSLVVKDANGCTSPGQSLTLTQPAALAILVSQTNVTSCSASSNGAISITASGGTNPYQYAIDSGTAFQSSGQFTGLAAGTYSVVVRDANGCQTTPRVVSITQPNALSVLVTKTDVSTVGGSNGTLSVSATGGTAPYQYSKDNGTTYQPNAPFTGLTAATYAVTVRDANGCVSQPQSVTISQPVAITVLASQTDITCYGTTTGIITVTATGGTTPYQYSDDNGITYQTGATFTGLGAGSYTVLVRDAGGIFSSPQPVTINQPAQTSFITSTTAVSCFGGNNGQILVSATGGTAPYQYSFDNGTTFRTANQAVGLVIGTYTVVVRDANGCVSTSQSVTVSQPVVVSLATSQTNVSCFGASTGVITLSASGGNTPYQYSINNGATFSSTASFMGLVAGTYPVVVRDANGCTSPAQLVTLIQPNMGLSLLTQATNPTSCSGGNGVISLTAMGGMTPYQYSYDGGASFQNTPSFSTVNGGTYQVLAKDANGCFSLTQSLTLTQPSAVSVSINQVNNTACTAASGNGSFTLTVSGGTAPYQYSNDNGMTYQASNQFVNVGGGIYSVVVRDANGCSSSTQSVSISQSSSLSLTISKTDIVCFGASTGSLTLTASGGLAPYRYSFNNGVNSQTTGSQSGLTAGVYSVVITDTNGCTTLAQSVTLIQPIQLQTTIRITNPTCTTAGSITVNASGGTAPYQYSKDNGTTYQPSNLFAELQTGTYALIIRDANGCTSSVQSVTLTQPTPLSLVVAKTAITACSGTSTGSINVTASGGTPPYQYSKDNGSTYQTANLFSTVSAGTYAVLVRDASGCTSVAQSITVTQPTVLTVAINQTDVACFGGNTGIIRVAASGGSAGYQYSRDNGTTFQSSSTFTNLLAGNYSVTVKDANGCVSPAQAVTLVQPAALSVTVTTTNATCSATGAIRIGATGGIAPYQYSTDNGITYQTSNSFTGLANGKYVVVVQDANGCVSTSQSVTISQAASVSFTTNQPIIYCFGVTGTVTVSAVGGTNPYQYSKDNGTNYQVNNAFTGLVAGTYQLVVKDANGCTTTAQSITLTQPAPLSLTTQKSDVSCANTLTGSIQISATGGTTPYQYSKDNGQTFQLSNRFTSLSAGTYSVVVKDANGCTTSAQSVTINQPTTITFTANQTNITCAGANTGSISVNAQGGTAPYQYSRDGGITFQTGARFTGLSAGSYTLAVNDANGCASAVQSVSLSQPAPLTLAVTTTAVRCFGGNTGALTVTVSGGTGPYQYSKDNGATFQSISAFTGLSAGSYLMVVNDANGCQTPAQVVVISQPTPLSTMATVTNVTTCNAVNANGSITISTTGGTTPYRYSLDNGTTFQTSNQFGNLTAGSYNVLVSDASGCVNTTPSVTLTQPSALSVTVVKTDVATCFGTNTGSLTITASGGTTPYQYSINNGTSFQVGNQFTGLTAGLVGVVVKDGNGCLSTVQSMSISQPSVLQFTTSQVNNTCFSGTSASITINATGGINPYRYSVDNGLTYTSSSIVTNLAAGIYTVLVRDANNCTASTQSVSISQPAALTISIPSLASICAGTSTGRVTVNVLGGTAPYQYSVDNGATFSSSNTINGLSSGIYTIIVKDAVSCVSVGQLVSIRSAPAVQFTTSVTAARCYGANSGSITVTATGGVLPYRYSIDNGATYQTSNQFTNLTASTYSLLVTDSLNCATSAQTVTVKQPTPFIVAVAPINITCNGTSTGSLIINATGGTSPYRYSVDNGTTFQATSQFVNLAAGNYTIRVLDANGCSAATQALSLTQPTGLSVTIAKTDIACNGNSTGSLRISASGGAAPYAFSTDNGVAFQANALFNGLKAGAYSVVVRDANGCLTIAQPVSLTQPAVLTLTLRSADALCSTTGVNTGSITATISGGTGPYQFSKDNGATFQSGATFTNLTAGNYTILAKDANGCQAATQLVTLRSSTAPTLRLSASPLRCEGDQNATVTAQVSGGTAPYVYAWNSNAQSTTTLTGVGAGLYTFRVTDTNNCQVVDTVRINRPLPLAIPTLATSQTICRGDTALFTASNPQATVQWRLNGTVVASTNQFSATQGGTYAVIITNPTGCQVSATTQLTLTTVRPESSILLSSQAKVGEVVELIDLTQPVPDSVRWVLPAGAALVAPPSGTPASRFVQYITFTQTGVYTIRSEVKALQVCTTRAANTIRIVSADQATFYDSTFASQPVSYDPDTFINDVTVSPNPNQGNFSVKITLKGTASVRVRLLDDKIGEFATKDANGDKTYDIPFSITPPAVPTFYYINVQVRYGANNSILVQKTIRVLVTN